MLPANIGLLAYLLVWQKRLITNGSHSKGKKHLHTRYLPASLPKRLTYGTEPYHISPQIAKALSIKYGLQLEL